MIVPRFDHCELLPPWPGSFPERLSAILAGQILDPKGLALSRYSTTDFVNVPIEPPSSAEIGPTWAERVEFLSPQLCSRFEEVGLRFALCPESASSRATEVFRVVAPLLKYDLGLQSSVESLVKAVHIIESKESDYDCSFSDPEIPFSIFISIPELAARNRELRVFEAIVHECMHLQLTAFEHQVPIVRKEGADACSYSPWKKSPRKIQGVLHGMYVFHVVAYAYSVLVESGALMSSDLTFARRRLNEISDDLKKVRGVETSCDLSPAGIGLAQAILAQAATLL
jgi:hypothetical protein